MLIVYILLKCSDSNQKREKLSYHKSLGGGETLAVPVGGPHL